VSAAPSAMPAGLGARARSRRRASRPSAVMRKLGHHPAGMRLRRRQSHDQPLRDLGLAAPRATALPTEHRRHSFAQGTRPRQRSRPSSPGARSSSSDPQSGQAAFLKNPQPTSRFSRQFRASSFPDQAVPSGPQRTRIARGDRLSAATIACKAAEPPEKTEGEGFEPSSEENPPKRFSRPAYPPCLLGFRARGEEIGECGAATPSPS
jgi:hypothetical protein